jgi:hypothetical protein
VTTDRSIIAGETLPDRFVSRETAAEFLGLATSTLACWASLRPPRGPRFTKLSAGRSGCVRYSLAELQRFAADPVAYGAPRPVGKFNTAAALKRGGNPRLNVIKARGRRGKKRGQV